MGKKAYMKAAVLFKNDDMRYCDFPIPKVGSGTVKVRVRATGICGSDVPRVLNNSAFFYPIVLGHEFAGDIVEVGEGVEKLKVGDKVAGAPLLPCHVCDDCQQGNYALCKEYNFIGSLEQGSFAEYVVLPERNAIKFDETVSYEQAALFEPATVAIHGLFCANYQGGESVAILGGGTIGIFTAQWAKIFGAKKVVVFDIEDHRLELAKRLGADEVINTTKPDYLETAINYTDGKGFGYIFEAAGRSETMNLAFEIAASKAYVCFIGTPHVDLVFSPKKWEKMNRKEFKLTGSWMSYSSPFPGKEWGLVAHYFASKQLKFDKDLIYKKFSLSEVKEAFDLFKRPGVVKGKIILITD